MPRPKKPSPIVVRFTHSCGHNGEPVECATIEIVAQLRARRALLPCTDCMVNAAQARENLRENAEAVAAASLVRRGSRTQRAKRPPRPKRVLKRT